VSFDLSPICGISTLWQLFACSRTGKQPERH
jgi:hypothetical protein